MEVWDTKINNRYCVAIETAFGADVGSYIDLFLENGEAILCVISDIKSDKDMLDDSITTIQNKCV